MNIKINFFTIIAIVITGTTVFFTSCNETEAEATSIELLSGGDQTGAIETTLTDVIEVQVKDEDGNAFEGATVQFETTEGAVFLTATSDSEGKANVEWTLGTTVGTQTMTVTAFKSDGTTELSGSPITVNATATTTITGDEFTISSIAIENGELLEAYKCEEKIDGVEKSIPLAWENVPAEANSLAIIMYHYPNPDDLNGVNSYLLLWDIATSVTEIAHGEADDGPWFMGANKDGNVVSYTSPCSPSAGVHEYTIKIYALSETPSSLPTESSIDGTYDVLTTAIESVTVVGTAEITFNDVTE